MRRLARLGLVGRTHVRVRVRAASRSYRTDWRTTSGRQKDGPDHSLQQHIRSAAFGIAVVSPASFDGDRVWCVGRERNNAALPRNPAQPKKRQKKSKRGSVQTNRLNWPYLRRTDRSRFSCSRREWQSQHRALRSSERDVAEWVSERAP